MRHKHADLIHAWAEGAEIQFKNSVYDTWCDCLPGWADIHEYRIKPKEPEWYENIPEHGVLCWVADKTDEIKIRVGIIHSYKKETYYPFCDGCTVWKYATPLTDEEIKQFLRGDK